MLLRDKACWPPSVANMGREREPHCQEGRGEHRRGCKSHDEQTGQCDGDSCYPVGHRSSGIDEKAQTDADNHHEDADHQGRVGGEQQQGSDHLHGRDGRATVAPLPRLPSKITPKASGIPCLYVDSSLAWLRMRMLVPCARRPAREIPGEFEIPCNVNMRT